MTKDEAVKKVYEFADFIEISELQIESIIDYLVDELGMLPPLHDLEHFPGMKDNGWES